MMYVTIDEEFEIDCPLCGGRKITVHVTGTTDVENEPQERE